MALIKPFRAVRPPKDKAAFVASRSYEEYGDDELNATLAFNPFSFLHIINPGFKYNKTVLGSERFQMVRNRYLEFLENGVLIKDDKPGIYIYEIEKGSLKTTGLFCATSVKDYEDNVIKKHEATILKREKLFADYLQTVGFNAEPVLMTYGQNNNIAQLIASETTKEPDYYFTTTDKVSHRLWYVADETVIQNLQLEFEGIDALYIADGHHRSASSKLLAKNLDSGHKKPGNGEPYHFFMSYLIPESDIKIYGFNRMVKDLNGHSKKEFLIQLDTFFRIEKRDNEIYVPNKKHHFSMYLDGHFYSLYLRQSVYNFTDALSRLDTQILYTTILQPILGIENLRTDKRIAYGYGKYNMMVMKESIDKGDFEVGFGMLPITMQEIKAVADAGLVMPPKSTYIEPKLRSGLTIYEW